MVMVMVKKNGKVKLKETLIKQENFFLGSNYVAPEVKSEVDMAKRLCLKQQHDFAVSHTLAYFEPNFKHNSRLSSNNPVNVLSSMGY